MEQIKMTKHDSYCGTDEVLFKMVKPRGKVDCMVEKSISIVTNNKHYQKQNQDKMGEQQPFE